MTGNTNSYSIILNNDNSMKLIVDYNDMDVGLAMLNSQKDANAKESEAKKVKEAADMAKTKASKNSEETNKQNEMIPGFQEELERHPIYGILSFLDSQMRKYIRYFFKKKVVNLSNTKKDELKVIMYPHLEHHYALMQTTADHVSNISTGDAATPSADSVEEV